VRVARYLLDKRGDGVLLAEPGVEFGVTASLANKVDLTGELGAQCGQRGVPAGVGAPDTGREHPRRRPVPKLAHGSPYAGRAASNGRGNADRNRPLTDEKAKTSLLSREHHGPVACLLGASGRIRRAHDEGVCLLTLISIPDDWDDNGILLFEEACAVIRTPQLTVLDWNERGIGPRWWRCNDVGRLDTTVAELRRFHRTGL